MAERYVFTPRERRPFMHECTVEIEWAAGLNKSRRMLNVERTHEAFAQTHKGARVFEVSRFGGEDGMALSAFNLRLNVPGIGENTVECFYQASKVFGGLGPYPDILAGTSMQAKKDPRIKGKPTAFQLGDKRFSLFRDVNGVGFYDRLYMNALLQNPELAERSVGFDGYSDVAFTPKMYASQSRSLAMWNGMRLAGMSPDEIEALVSLA